MMTNTTDWNNKNTKEIDKTRRIDFKMISFILAEKDYAIDILKVKEIRKESNFTKVPNTPSYVRGVNNLRGDIIPIIDLRIMFNLPVATKELDAVEDMIILRLDDLILGIVVDSIEKVVGISSSSIQPPHPIFGDINIRYISGVVEHEEKLYIILDVDKILGPNKLLKQQTQDETSEPSLIKSQENEISPDDQITQVQSQPHPQTNLDLQFITENLETFCSFFVSDLNRSWVTSRLTSWKERQKNQEKTSQLPSKEEAEEFLQEFYSPFTRHIWNQQFISELAMYIEIEQGSFQVWNPGCAQGHESYSLALMLEGHLGTKDYKIRANDNDLLSISMAPSLAVNENEIIDEHKRLTVQTTSGLQFSPDTKAHILFEFHDITHINPFGQLNLIVARDLLSFLKKETQEQLLTDFCEKLKSGGHLVLGKNEKIPPSNDWTEISLANWSIYRKL